MVVATALDTIMEDIAEIFIGDSGIFGAEPVLAGLFVFLIFAVLTLIFGLGMLIGSVVLIPVLFLVFETIPDLRIIVAIFMGLIFGIGLSRIVRR
jgi:hypothetical protein